MKIKNGLEQDSMSGGKNIKKKTEAVKRKSVPFLVVILVVTSVYCLSPETIATHHEFGYSTYTCLYSSSRTMQMLTTPNQRDVDNPPKVAGQQSMLSPMMKLMIQRGESDFQIYPGTPCMMKVLIGCTEICIGIPLLVVDMSTTEFH
jgi:hypothetical protein